MDDLFAWQYAAIACTFIWSGFVRSALGFGGSVLALPFLLMILNQPLVYLPILAVHLLFFSFITIYGAHRRERRRGRSGVSVNWAFLRYAIPLMFVPKLIGVFGVINLPPDIISAVVFSVVSVYSVTYILDRPLKSHNRYVDALFLLIGGYVSGVSLVAAPLVVPVAASRVEKHQLRDTLFILWSVLVVIKLTAFIWSGVDLQWRHQLWLLPCATLGHLVGLKFHAYSLRADGKVFFRAMGGGLLLVSLVGILRLVL